MMQIATSECRYYSAKPNRTSQYLWPRLLGIVRERLPQGGEIFELGCGSGATAAMLSKFGYSVTAADPSVSGISLAKEAYPNVRFVERSAYDPLAKEFGSFDAVISLEVIEHCFWPRKFADTVHALLKPGGFAVISTPFHGYWKNLALALVDAMDSHWSPLSDGGHIKFWSEKTLGALLEERGFSEVFFLRAGRISPLAKSMIAVSGK